jgi:hypothetical protein
MTGALTLAVATTFAPAAGARTSAGIKTFHSARAAGVRPQSTQSVLYDQNNNDSSVGISSQNFETSFDVYDDQGADSFKVPAGQTWKIKEVDVTGVYFNGDGPAVSENVTFYKNSGGLPGAVIKSVTLAGTDSGTGSFAITGITGVKLTGGKYWVSVQVNMDFDAGGQWGWDTRTVQSGFAAAWQNPADGLATGCTVYANMQGCIGAQGEGPDFMFALRGRQT